MSRDAKDLFKKLAHESNLRDNFRDKTQAKVRISANSRDGRWNKTNIIIIIKKTVRTIKYVLLATGNRRETE